MSHIKIPNTKYNVNSLFVDRWSPRAFSEKSISTEDLMSMFEAASWAASAMNDQPWRYIAAQKENTESFNQLVDCLNPANQIWAKNAAVLIISGMSTIYSSNQKPNGGAMHDLGLANQNLILQAQSKNIYSHIMGGFDKEKATSLFNSDGSIVAHCMIALSYLGDPELLDETLKQRELTGRSRRPIEDFVTML